MLLKPGQLNLRPKIVPGGSHWSCERCGGKFNPGDTVYATAHKRYCARCQGKVEQPPTPKTRVKRRSSPSMLRSHQED